MDKKQNGLKKHQPEPQRNNTFPLREIEDSVDIINLIGPLKANQKKNHQ